MCKQLKKLEMWRASSCSRRAHMKPGFTQLHNPTRAFPRLESPKGPIPLQAADWGLSSRCRAAAAGSLLEAAFSDHILFASMYCFRLITYNPVVFNISSKCNLLGQVSLSKINVLLLLILVLSYWEMWRVSASIIGLIHLLSTYLGASTSINTCHLSELNCPQIGSQKKNL